MAQYNDRIKKLPLRIYDNDPYQLLCLFSPNFERYIDIDSTNASFVVRDWKDGEKIYGIPRTFLNYNGKDEAHIVQ